MAEENSENFDDNFSPGREEAEEMKAENESPELKAGPQEEEDLNLDSSLKNEEENPALRDEIVFEGHEGVQPPLEGEQLLQPEELPPPPPPPPPPNPFEESPLEPEVKLLLELIFDEEIHRRQLQAEDVDLPRFDFKAFSQENMAKSYAILSEILENIIRKKTGKILETQSQAFYQLIPHKFPQKKMMVLDSESKIFAKIELLNLINDLQIAYGLNEEQRQLKIKAERERREREKRELEELERKKKAAEKKDPKKDPKKKTVEKEKEKEPVVDDQNPEEQKQEEEVIVIEDVKNFYDRNYENLHCKIETLSPTTKQFELVSIYINETIQGIPQFYTCEILNVFKLGREAETPVPKVQEVPEEKTKEKETKNERKKGKKEVEEEKAEETINGQPVIEYTLLMYGCKVSNLVANLSKGLRPPHASAPMKAYKLGKGIYFSDAASKSTNFCYVSPENNVGFLIFCMVDLGLPLEKTSKAPETTQAMLPKGKKSLKGIGRIAPKDEKIANLNELDKEKCREDPPLLEESPNENVENEGELGHGLENPFESQKNGQEQAPDESSEIRLLKIPDGELGPTTFKDSTFLYNEYVVFDEKQIRMSYLVKLKFNFK